MIWPWRTKNKDDFIRDPIRIEDLDREVNQDFAGSYCEWWKANRETRWTDLTLGSWTHLQTKILDELVAMNEKR